MRLEPIENPPGLLMKLAGLMARRQLGKVEQAVETVVRAVEGQSTSGGALRPDRSADSLQVVREGPPCLLEETVGGPCRRGTALRL